MDNVKFWLKSDIFEAAILPHRPTNRITVSNLRKIFIYCKKSSYNDLSLELWLKVACDKLKMNIDLATLYFDITWGFFASVEQKNLYYTESVTEERHVRVTRLLLILFLQLFVVDPLSLKRSRSLERLSIEKWPTSTTTRAMTVSPMSPTLLSVTKAKILDEEVYVDFIKDRIDDLKTVFNSDDVEGFHAFCEVLSDIVGVCSEDEKEIDFECLLQKDIGEVLKKKIESKSFWSFGVHKVGEKGFLAHWEPKYQSTKKK